MISDFHLDVTKDSAPATVAATQDGDSAIHVRVHPDALLPAGPHEFALRLNAKGVVEGELPEQIIRIPGRVVEDIEVVPPFLRMRKVNVGESDPVHTVKLRSRTAQPFRVVAISASAASVRVSPISTLDEMTDAFACDVSAVGDNHGELSINTVTFDVLALGSRQHAISVPLEIVVSKK